MNCLTPEQRERLLAQGRVHRNRPEDDYALRPVVKLFIPNTRWVCLLATLDPDQPDRAYGLYDAGRGEPTLGDVLLSELDALKASPEGSSVMCDMQFNARKTLHEYAMCAKRIGMITAMS